VFHATECSFDSFTVLIRGSTTPLVVQIEEEAVVWCHDVAVVVGLKDFVPGVLSRRM